MNYDTINVDAYINITAWDSKLDRLCVLTSNRLKCFFFVLTLLEN